MYDTHTWYIQIKRIILDLYNNRINYALMDSYFAKIVYDSLMKKIVKNLRYNLEYHYTFKKRIQVFNYILCQTYAFL